MEYLEQISISTGKPIVFSSDVSETLGIRQSRKHLWFQQNQTVMIVHADLDCETTNTMLFLL